MVRANIKVKRMFDNRLAQLRLGDKLTKFEMEMIMKTLQETYDLAHADGYSEGFGEYYNNAINNHNNG